MKKILLLAISILVLSIPITTVEGWRGDGKMNGSGSGSGSESGSGPSPHYGGAEDRRIGDGSRQRFGSDRPDMGILDENGNGISMTIESISYSLNGTVRSVDSTNTSWTLKATGTEDNFTKEYSLVALLGGKVMSRVLFRYQVMWHGEEGNVRYNLSIGPIPPNGTLRVRYSYHLQGEGLGSFHGSGKGMTIRSGDGALLGSMDQSDQISSGGVLQDLAVEWETDGANATMNAIASIEGTSAEIGGTMTILEGFISVLSDLAGEAVDYVMDHIVSFSIGSAVLIVLGVVLLSFVGRRKPNTHLGLDLRNNRYYKG